MHLLGLPDRYPAQYGNPAVLRPAPATDQIMSHHPSETSLRLSERDITLLGAILDQTPTHQSHHPTTTTPTTATPTTAPWTLRWDARLLSPGAPHPTPAAPGDPSLNHIGHGVDAVRHVFGQVKKAGPRASATVQVRGATTLDPAELTRMPFDDDLVIRDGEQVTMTVFNNPEYDLRAWIEEPSHLKGRDVSNPARIFGAGEVRATDPIELPTYPADLGPSVDPVHPITPAGRDHPTTLASPESTDWDSPSSPDSVTAPDPAPGPSRTDDQDTRIGQQAPWSSSATSAHPPASTRADPDLTPSETTGWFGLIPQNVNLIKGTNTADVARNLARAWFSLLQHHDDTRHQHQRLSAVLDANPTPMQVGTGPKAWRKLVTQLEKLPTGSFAIVRRAWNYSVLLHHSDRGIRVWFPRDRGGFPMPRLE
ncbi:hypothetical protein HX744_13575 [Pseudonocardia sp. ICBG1122]|nr:hypothetical protein [Pseudonocardia pini]